MLLSPIERNTVDAILSFFSNLILLTAGLFVILFWIVLFVLIGIEIWDQIFGEDETDSDDQEVY